MKKQDIVNHNTYHGSDNSQRDIEQGIKMYYNDIDRERAIKTAKELADKTIILKQEVALAYEEAINEDIIRENNNLRTELIINSYPFLEKFTEQYGIPNISMDNSDLISYKLLEKGIIKNYGNDNYHGIIFFVVDLNGIINQVPYREECINLENKKTTEEGEIQGEYDVLSKAGNIKDYIEKDSICIITYNMNSMEKFQSASILPL